MYVRNPIRDTWTAMKQRCTNPKNPEYKNYGARGIKVCDRWINNCNAFMSDMGERPDKHTLERIDNDSNYEPSNCRWATQSEQNYNQRVRRDNKHGVTGLSWDKSRNKWRATRYANNKQLWSKRFNTKEEAIKALA